MGAFQDIELVWRGQTYVVKAHRVMGAIYRIEDLITLDEFTEYAQRGAAPLAKLCGAYSAVLKYAGASVSSEDVYAELFKDANQKQAVMEAVINLMQMMLPADARAKVNAVLAQGDGVAAPGNLPAAAAASSKRRTKPRSQKAGG
jgi:hypothetical protein